MTGKTDYDNEGVSSVNARKAMQKKFRPRLQVDQVSVRLFDDSFFLIRPIIQRKA